MHLFPELFKLWRLRGSILKNFFLLGKWMLHGQRFHGPNLIITVTTAEILSLNLKALQTSSFRAGLHGAT